MGAGGSQPGQAGARAQVPGAMGIWSPWGWAGAAQAVGSGLGKQEAADAVPLSSPQYTEEQGRKLGLAGWVRNTPRGTVTGQVQGPKDKVEIM